MELTAVKRDQFGRAARLVREKGLIPAELYGNGIKNEHVAVAIKDFRRVLKQAGETTLITLVIDGKKHPVFIHEVTTHPVSDAIMSIDFYQVRMDEKLTMKVPLLFVGEASAVKEKGGVLVKAMSELKVEGLPADIPQNIEISLAPLSDIGSSIHVSDLSIAKNLKIVDDGRAVVATVIAKMTEEQEAKLAAATDVSTIKSETEEKVAERAAAKEAGAAPAEAAPAK